jgi:hypothetical protein
MTEITNNEFVRQTVELVKSIETRFLELGARLYKIREERLWEGTFNSFEDFLAEIKMTKGNASILASVHKNYVLEGGIEPQQLAGIPYSNLYEAIPLIEKEGVTSAAVKAETLTRSEIKDEVQEKKLGVHEHIIGDERWGVCSCGKFIKIHEENLS